MKGDTESLVNVARLRPHHVGVDSIEDQHKHDIELAEEEIRVINETIKLMQERKEAWVSSSLSLKRVREKMHGRVGVMVHAYELQNRNEIQQI